MAVNDRLAHYRITHVIAREQSDRGTAPAGASKRATAKGGS